MKQMNQLQIPVYMALQNSFEIQGMKLSLVFLMQNNRQAIITIKSSVIYSFLS